MASKTSAQRALRWGAGAAVTLLAVCIVAAGGAFLAVREWSGGASPASPQLEQAVDAALSPDQVFRNALIAVRARVEGTRRVELWVAIDGSAAKQGEGDRYTGIAYSITLLEALAGGELLEGRELDVHIMLRQESRATDERPASVVTQDTPDLKKGGEYVLFLLPSDFAGIRALSAATLPWDAEVRGQGLKFVSTDAYLNAVRPHGHDGMPAAFAGISLSSLPGRIAAAKHATPQTPADSAFCLKAEAAVRDAVGRAIDFDCRR
ncbi:MAG: hypothetical protein ACKVVT_17615 [Dehalococcoidia bacterium]